MLFGESLKTLLESYKFRNGRSVVVKGFTLENIEDLDVLVSDYNHLLKHQDLRCFPK